jgi:hypothetical protein
MTTPTITSLSTTLGPSHQWVYVVGTNFVQNNTQFYFNNIPCTSVAVYDDTNAGFYMPENISGTGNIKVVTPNGEYTSDIQFVVGVPTQPPTVLNVRPHPNVNWVYVDGTEFVSGQSTVTYGSNTVNLFVYTTSSGGFAKANPSDTISSITLTTPYGSVNYNIPS